LLRLPEMQRVLIAGCGYVGTATARLFAEAGWDVTGWVRSAQIPRRAGYRELSLGLVDITSLEAVRTNAFAADVVVHCASSGSDSYRRVYRDGVANLVTCFPDARVIFTSSTSVYAQQDDSLVTEDSPAEPPSEDARTLREAEEIVLAHGGIVLRLAGIYGAGRSYLLRSVINGVAIETDRIANQIHRDDVASAIFFLGRYPNVNPPRIFNVVDDTPTQRREILDWLSKRLNLPMPPSTAPGKEGGGPARKRVSNSKLRGLGWAPAYPSYREGFDQSVIPALENCGV
jgi:nucleoside-diphosphate-sugar epimerase